MDPFQELVEGLLEAQQLVERQGSTSAQAAVQFALDWLTYDEDNIRFHFQLKEEEL